MKPLLAAALVLLALLMVPGAVAVTPTPVATLVGEITSVTFGGASDFEGDGVLNFPLASNDPDQTTGTFNYTILLDGVAVGNLSRSAIPNNPGWVTVSPNLSGATGESLVNLTVIPWDDTTPGGVSCDITLDFAQLGDFDQCGSTLRAVPGLAAQVLNITDPPTEADIRLLYTVSPDDPNQVEGNFTYTVVFREYPDGIALTLTDSSTFSGTNGTRQQLHQVGGDPITIQYQIRAENPDTLERAPLSCSVRVNNGVPFDTDACGDQPFPGSVLSTGGPSWPGLDIQQQATSWGISAANYGLILAALAILGFALLGFRLAGLTGASIGVAAGVTTTATLNVLPLFWLVLIFLAAAAVAVLTFIRPQGASA